MKSASSEHVNFRIILLIIVGVRYNPRCVVSIRVADEPTFSLTPFGNLVKIFVLPSLLVAGVGICTLTTE